MEDKFLNDESEHYYPVFNLDGNKVILCHKDMYGNSEQEAIAIALLATITLNSLGLHFAGEVKIMDEDLKYFQAELPFKEAGITLQVGFVGGPIFDNMVKYNNTTGKEKEKALKYINNYMSLTDKALPAGSHIVNRRTIKTYNA